MTASPSNDTTSTVIADRVFDGTTWHGPTQVTICGATIMSVMPWSGRHAPGEEIRCGLLIPGLIDFGASAWGYQESPRPADPFAPEGAFATLCLRYGVTTVVDLANSTTSLAQLHRTFTLGQGPRVVFAGARLCDTAHTPRDLIVERADVGAAIDAHRGLGATFVSIGDVGDPDLLAHIHDEADARDLDLVEPFGTDAQVPGALWHGARDAIAPQLEATSRWTVDGLLLADDAHLAAPVLPFHKHFARMKGRVGRRIAKPILERIYTDRTEDRLDPGLVPAAAAAIRSGQCLASTGAGGAGLVPGCSLWSEMQKIIMLSSIPDSGLVSTTGAADLLRATTGLGHIRAGGPADLVLIDDVGQTEHAYIDLPALRSHVTSVMVNGTLHNTEVLDARVREMVELSLKEAAA